MLDIIDSDLEDSIRKALAANPELAERVLELMAQGCETIETFDLAIDQIQKLGNRSGPIVMASEAARKLFSVMLDIFGELLAISTGSVDEPGDD